MPEASTDVAETARKSQTLILRALASAGQRTVADAIGKSETFVSRWKSEDLETCAALLAAAGLKVVPADVECHTREYVSNMRYFARIGMSIERPPTLVPDFDS